MKAIKRLVSQAGYSLTEIMIAVGIASVVMLGVATIIEDFQANLNSIYSVMDFDEEAFRLQYFFMRPFRSAVNLKNAGNVDINSYSPPTVGVTALEGRLRGGFDSSTVANDNTIATALAVFARDTATMGAGPTDQSSFKGAAIYFQQPSLTTYGVLYFVTQGSGVSNNVFAPTKSAQFSTNVVRVIIENVVNSGAFVQSFTVHVYLRFPTSGSPANINWCYVKSDCGANGAPTKDIERRFTVNLYNNFDPADATQKLPLGRIFFLGRGS